MALARNFKELRVYSLAFEGAMQLFQMSNGWPDGWCGPASVREDAASYSADVPSDPE